MEDIRTALAHLASLSRPGGTEEEEEDSDARFCQTPPPPGYPLQPRPQAAHACLAQ